jgi:hypothetical protein
MYMTITKMCIRIKLNLITIVAAVLATLLLFVDVASVSAFNGKGRPSGPAPYRNGPGYSQSDRGPGYSRSDRGPRYYRSDHGPGYFRGDRGPRYYRDEPFSPYGGPRRDGYGERRAVRSRGEAQRMLNDYYMSRSMRIGPLRENRFYFEADVLDRNNRSIDRVIIDKRSGRIRSIY